VNVNCTHYFSWRSHTVSDQQAVCTLVCFDCWAVRAGQ